MALWGKSTSAESRPKFLGGDGAIQKKEECFATTRGWEIKAGTKASGNGNANAQPELLVAIGGLSTVLGAANLLSVDWTDGTYAHDGSADFDITFTYDGASSHSIERHFCCWCCSFNNNNCCRIVCVFLYKGNNFSLLHFHTFFDLIIPLG